MLDAIKPRIIHSTSFNPWVNLSIEEYLLTNVKSDEVILYLWQNDNTVVIGRNQNPWKECDCEALTAAEGKLARRLSGGGAVFHDLGNLNFTFVMNKKHYDVRKQQMVIIDALKKHGIEAIFSGRNDMLIDGRKFSGHAYYSNGTNAYHHGTILVHTDFEKLSGYLNPSAEKIKSKSVASVKSRVINIEEVSPGMTTDQIKRSMAESFVAHYGPASNSNFESTPDAIMDLYEKYSSWDWCYGKSPAFDITHGKRFDWGEVEINLTLKSGMIKEVKIFSDAMDVEMFQRLSEVLVGCPYHTNPLLEAVKQNIVDEMAQKDLVEWIKNWGVS
jgi:lipoate-protein ligase A